MKTFSAVVALLNVVSLLATMAEASQDYAPAFMRSLGGYNYMKFEQCVVLEVEIPQEGSSEEDADTEVEELEVVTESVAYVAYRMCTNCSLKKCSDSTFLAPLTSVIGNLVSFTQNYCNKCSSNCGDEAAEGFSSSCETCLDECQSILAADDTDDYSTDETKSLWCTAAYVDRNNYQYYSKASCGRDGHLMIGLYSDGECTVEVSSSTYSKKFDYNTFNAMESFCMDCAENECNSEENLSLECVKGENKNTNLVDDMNVCHAYHEAAKKWVPNFHSAEGVNRIALIALAVIVFGCVAYVIYKHIVQYLDERETERIVTSEGGPGKNGQYAVMT